MLIKDDNLEILELKAILGVTARAELLRAYRDAYRCGRETTMQELSSKLLSSVAQDSAIEDPAENMEQVVTDQVGLMLRSGIGVDLVAKSLARFFILGQEAARSCFFRDKPGKMEIMLHAAKQWPCHMPHAASILRRIEEIRSGSDLG